MLNALLKRISYFLKGNILLCLFLFISVTCFSQQYYYKNYTTKDGLPSNEVYYVLQDSKGYMWFATNYGVSRFDGYTFTNFDSQNGLPDNTVFEIFEDYKGRIWFISSSAKLSYYYNDSIHLYWNNEFFLKTIKEVPIITNKTFNVDEQDNVYVGIARKGIWKISKDGKITRKNSIIPNLQNYLIIGIDKNKAYMDCFFKKIFYYNTYVQKGNNVFKLKKISQENTGTKLVALGLKNELFFSEYAILYSIYDSIHVLHKKFNDRIISLNVIHDNLWVGTYFGGFYCFKYGDITKEPESHLFIGKAGSNVIIDKEGGYWFSTLTNGVYYAPSFDIMTFPSKENFNENSIDVVELGRNEIICASNKSSFIYFIINNKINKIKFSPQSESINNLYYDKTDNAIWYGTNVCAYRYKEGIHKKFDSYFRVLDSLSFSLYTNHQITKGSNGNIWVAAVMGLLKINKDTTFNYNTKNNFFRIFTLEEDKNSEFWLGCNDGLYKFIKGEYIYYGNKNPLLKNRITFIKKCAYDNSLWIATKGAGILIMKGDSVKQILSKDGLLSNHIKHLFVDNNTIWASSTNGLNKIIITQNAKNPYRIEQYTQSDGLYSSDVNGVVVNNDTVYVATNDGLSFFNSKKVGINSIPPPVYITKVKIMNKDTSVLDTYTLPYNKNFIEINFVGLSYRTAGNITYKYRLTGVNEDWVITKIPQILYPMLSPGEYKFEVVAMNKDGIYSTTPAVILFIIKPPFWKTFWFYGLCVLLFAIILRMFFYYRIKNIKRRNSLKLELNKYMQQALCQQMNPHFIFNSINSIHKFILENDKDLSSYYLSKFSSLMRQTMENSMKDTISLKEEIDALKLYLDLEQLRFNRSFDFNILLKDNMDAGLVEIPPFLFQPYVENSIWHGLMNKKDGRGKIDIKFSIEGGLLICSITDNGIGREKANELKANSTKVHKSYGTSITEKRISALFSLINIEAGVTYEDLTDESGKAIGTRVIVKIAIN